MEDCLKDLYKEAEALAERPIEVVKTKDGKYIVLWMSFSSLPPPKADTINGAVQLFVEYMREKKKAGLEKDDEEL